VARLEPLEAFGERVPEEVQTEPSPIIGALSPGLGAPGPAIQLGRDYPPSVPVRRN
jgi:hypothetical protein